MQVEKEIEDIHLQLWEHKQTKKELKQKKEKQPICNDYEILIWSEHKEEVLKYIIQYFIHN